MDRARADLLIRGASEVLTCAGTVGDPLGRIAGGAVAVVGERIAAVGTIDDVAAQVDLDAAQVIDASGCVVAPGFVDCHTHLVFAGSRSLEYAARMTRGADEVAALGIPTGIPASVAMTRAADADRLFVESAGRLARMFRSGSTTIESKSGYGLCLEAEIRMLETNRRLARAFPADIVATFLGAHDFPPDMPRARYVDRLVHEMIPTVAAQGLAEFCDVYCDEGYFTLDQTRRILEAGRDCGLLPRIHADAYSATGVAALAIELGAASVDHLNFTTPLEMRRLAAAGVVGVGLPALDFAVDHPRPVDLRAVLESGMTLALATNLNPGNWTETMHFVLVLACRRHRISPQEALMAATVGGARALRREAEIGSLAPGRLADLQLWEIPAFEDYIYRLDGNSLVGLVKRGQVVASPGAATTR